MPDPIQPIPNQPVQPQVVQLVTPAAVPANQPVAQAQPVQVQQPAPVQAAPVYAPAPAQVQAQRPVAAPATVPARPGQPVQPLKPGTIVRKPPNPKKLIYGCVGCSGFLVLFFIIFVLIFVAQTSPAGDNPLAKSLGLDPGSFTNTLILLVNLVFGAISVILFLLAIIGLFRLMMARKDDKEARKKGLTMAGISGVLFTIFVFIWVGIYLFLSSKKVIIPKTQSVGIVTEPANTLNLTAPILIKFDSSSAPINKTKYQILSYLWDFGDGETSTVAQTSHTYSDKGKNNGRFDVTLTIDMSDKQTNAESKTNFTTIVTIANVQLNAEFTATPDSGPAPLSVDFDASTSKAPAGDITAYDWDFINNNLFKDGSGVKVSHTFDQVGIYPVNLRVTDNTGQFKVVTKNITVTASNVPAPVIEIPTTDGKYYTNVQYSFLGEKTTSPNGKINKYEWDFGDGTPKANTRTANHIYKTSGTFDVTLTATDETNVSGTLTQKIKVEIADTAPIAAITTVPAIVKGQDYLSGTVPFTVSFDGSSSQDKDNNIVDYKWDFNGDGEIDANGQTTSYVYKTDGIYNATLTVVDGQNQQSNAVLVVKVGAQPLQAKLSADPVEGNVPLTVTFDASGSSYPNGQIVSYEWDFGDGSAKRIDTSKVTYKYTKIGTFTAKVTAIASDNTKSTAQTPVNIRPISLTACFAATPESGPSPLTVEFDPRCSTGTVAKYSWDFGDTSTSKTRKPTHTFTLPGNYQVTLEVADSQNIVNTYTKNVLVTGPIT